ncbi:MAG: PH domain-containing protein [Acidimicrobiia bacterium]|nr:PH domain-containing protein [Acidimicrobiia bacterium]
MAYSEKLLTEGERVIREFRPHWRLLFIPVLWLIGGIVAIVFVNTTIPPDDGTIDLITSLVIVVALVPLVFGPLIRWWFTAYILTNERLITRTGVISRSGVEIPLENIANVLFHQNVIERLLGSGDLLIESAGESGQSPFNDIPKPDEFQALLYRVREERTKGLAQTQASAVPNAAMPDATERLERLARLHRDGVITEDEYTEKRQQLLDEI